MKKYLRAVCVTIMACLPWFAWAEDSMVRLVCDEADGGPQVYVNGQLKGLCESKLAVSVRAGRVTIMVRKAVDADHERVWEKTLDLAEGVLVPVEVQLSEPRLTQAAVERQRQEAARAEKEAAESLLREAQGGKVDAMFDLARSYADGRGLPTDAKLAAMWQQRGEQARARAVEANEKAGAQEALARAGQGAREAMEEMARRYRDGQGVPKDTGEAGKWQARADAARRQQEAAIKLAQRQKELDQFSFFQTTKDSLDRFRTQNMQVAHASGEMAGCSEFFLTGPFVTVLGLMSDALSAPTRTAEYMKLREEAESHAAAVYDPNSLVGALRNVYGVAGATQGASKTP